MLTAFTDELVYHGIEPGSRMNTWQKLGEFVHHLREPVLDLWSRVHNVLAVKTSTAAAKTFTVVESHC